MAVMTEEELQQLEDDLTLIANAIVRIADNLDSLLDFIEKEVSDDKREA